MRYKLHVADVARLQGAGVVTLSAGNAGKAVAYLGRACGYDAKVFMPESAPDERKAMMEAMGATVLKVPAETLLTLTLNSNPNPNPTPTATPTPHPSPNQVPGETLLSAVAECIAAEQRVPPSY